MTMYAVIRVSRLDPGKAAQAAGELRWLEELHTEQPGFLGTIIVDVAGDRQVRVNLWDSEEHSRAGLAVLAPWASRLLTPLMTEPSRLVGAGDATTTGGLRLARSW